MNDSEALKQNMANWQNALGVGNTEMDDNAVASVLANMVTDRAIHYYTLTYQSRTAHT